MTDIWLDGGFVSAEAAIDASDRGLLLGDGVFDTALVIGGTVFRRADHLDRLAAALDALAIPVARGALETAADALAARRPNGSIRLTVTRGPGPRGIALPATPRPTILGSAAPLTPAAMFAPVRLAWAEARRNDTSPLSRLKSLSYLDAILASDAARAEGADEALFLNTRGMVACSSLANVFVLQGNLLATPPLADGVLPGIMRRWVIHNAARFGLTATERSLTAADAQTGRMFLSNSLRLLAPAYLNGETGELLPLPVQHMMEGLCEAIGAECGTDPRDFGAAIGAA